MPSDTYEKRLGERSEALDSLVAVHSKVTGGTDAAIQIANSLRSDDDNAKVLPVILYALVKGRRLDRGNADFGALVTDFAVLGMDLNGAMKGRWPVHTCWTSQESRRGSRRETTMSRRRQPRPGDHVRVQFGAGVIEGVVTRVRGEYMTINVELTDSESIDRFVRVDALVSA